MNVIFQYQDHKVDNELYYANSIISWSVNGIEAYNIKEPAIRKYIYLVKKTDATIDVFLDELSIPK